jgi:serine protease Do
MPGKKVPAEIIREGKRRTITVEVGELKDEKEAAPSPAQDDSGGRFGLQLQALPPPMAQQLGIKGGALVAGVEPGSIAEQKGIQGGDVILEANQKRIDNVQELIKVLKATKSGDIVRLLIRRNDNQYFVALPKP